MIISGARSAPRTNTNGINVLGQYQRLHSSVVVERRRILLQNRYASIWFSEFCIMVICLPGSTRNQRERFPVRIVIEKSVI